MEISKQADKTYTFSEYLELEKQTQEKHDFYYGEVYNMAGGTKRHNEIIQEIIFSLRKNIDTDKCKIYFDDVKLEIQESKFYVYPDIMLTCDETDLLDNKETLIRNPIIIIEVLSSTTELYDRNTKKKHYLKLPSLKYYLLVSQENQRIEMYEKVNSHIEYSYYEKPDETINFRQLGFEILVADIYGK